jgi:hypothetical protein
VENTLSDIANLPLVVSGEAMSGRFRNGEAMKHTQRTRKHGLVNMSRPSSLIPYGDTPQVTALEYKELRDIRKRNSDPEVIEMYKNRIKNRMARDAKERRKDGIKA